MSNKTWHPYTEPPDDMRKVILRFSEEAALVGFYSHIFGGYTVSERNARRLHFVHPTHWRELTEEEK